MLSATYLDAHGKTTKVQVAEGITLMQAAQINGVEGIEGECSGSCACATCHCYVDANWLDLLPPMSEMEAELLEGASAERQAGSRLSCQIKMTAELDGIQVALPKEQG